MKKTKLPEHKAGIWLDQETAYIVHLSGELIDKVEGLISDVESRVRMAGEGKVYARFGHAFLDNQEKTQHRQTNQRGKFFKAIIHRLQGVGTLYIFGPGQARSGLHRMLEKDPVLAGHTAECVPADRMNKRQAVAATLAYFKSDAYKQYKKDRRLALKAMN
jgi:hypothetical protein